MSWLLPILFGISVLLFWKGILQFGDISAALLPSPEDVFLSWVSLAHTIDYYRDILATLSLMLHGLALGILFGIPLGFLTGTSTFARHAFWPYIQVLRSLPAVAFIPVMLILFPNNFGRVAIIGLSCAALMAISTAEGISLAPEERMRFIQTARLSHRKLFIKFYLPEIAGQLFIGLRIAAGLALILAVVLEMLLGSLHGLGEFINSYSNNNRDAVFAVICTLGLLGVFLNALIEKISRAVIYWKK